jgi:hypothetical protein
MVPGAKHESSGRRQLQPELTRAIIEPPAPGCGLDANAEQSLSQECGVGSASGARAGSGEQCS